jgi:hypothetical protein
MELVRGLGTRISLRRRAHVWNLSGITLRIGIVGAALAILYLRMPTYFTNPQFWGEDIIFFSWARSHGWASLLMAVSGYFCSVQLLVAIVASYFSPIVAPAIYVYASFLLTLIVVWLVTSPRLDLPGKPLLALAVVVVPMGQEELGTLVNVMWILPIGAFAMLFMRAGSGFVLLGEAAFVGLVAFSGVFSIFLTPLFLWQTVSARNTVEFRRFLILTVVVGLGALAQILNILTDPTSIPAFPAIPYSWTLWINLPLSRIMTVFNLHWPPNRELLGVAVGIAFLIAAISLAFLEPYRKQKSFMLFFSLFIAVGGMLKFRHSLGTQLGAQRYFYSGSVFALWFLCCGFGGAYLRYALTSAVALVELMLLPAVANTSYFKEDLQWSVWAHYIDSGIPTITPTPPGGWNLRLPASVDGPLARFAPWIGKTISQTQANVDPSACAGHLAHLRIAAQGPSKNLWFASGSTQDSPAPPILIVLTDADEKVIAFGVPGFKTPDSTREWRSLFDAPQETVVRSYGLLADGRICPHHIDFIASEQYVSPATVMPGNSVSQRFKPMNRFDNLSVKFVTYGRKPSPDLIAWRVVGSIGGRAVELGAGTFDPAEVVVDWGDVDLPLSMIPQELPDEVEVSFNLADNTMPAAPVGIPLYKPAYQTIPAEVAGKPVPDGTQVGVRTK